MMRPQQLLHNRRVVRESDVGTSHVRAVRGSLFDRLILDDEDMGFIPAQGSHIGRATQGEHIEGIVRSIKRNLDRVLNMHAGGAAANPQLGIEDMNHSTVSSKEISEHIVASIRDCITCAEPRINSVDVRYMSDAQAPLTLQFAITCLVNVASVEEQIRIDLAMRDGHFHQLDH